VDGRGGSGTLIAMALLAAGLAHAGLPDFPIAVWCQDPVNAAKFRAAGINLYVALWKGPTEDQLAALKAAGMPVVCDQNEVGLKHLDDPVIAAWMHGDEPDNAQSLPDGKEGYGPPIPPADIVASHDRIRKRDPSRPVILNLGQGVAWDNWYGRGVRTNHPEDYAEYAKGCDIASFDIYPAVHDHAEVAGKLWFVPSGVARLRGWAPGKTVWNCIEASRISNVKVSPSPAEIRFEVWSAIIAGSRGIIYFVHQFSPKFVEASLLENPELLAAVTALNRQVTELAPVINGEAIEGGFRLRPGRKGDRFSFMRRRYAGTEYLFLALWSAEPGRATFSFTGRKNRDRLEVVGESRDVPFDRGGYRDTFLPWAVHIYRIGK